MIEEPAVGDLDFAAMLLGSTRSALSYVDRLLRLRYATPAFRHWFGQDPEGVVGRPLRDAIGPVLLAQYEPRLQAALAGEVQEFERDVPGPGGEVRHALVRCIPHRSGGAVQGVVIEVADVSRLKAGQRALQRSESRLRSIFESALDGILTADDRQRVLLANPAAARMFATRPEAMVGRPLEDFMPPRYHERHRAEVRAFGAGTVHARRMGMARLVIAMRADGTEFPVDASISHASVEGACLYTAILRDDSERVRQQQALRQGEAKLRAALDSMSDAVFISDIEGRLLELNEGFVRFHRFASLASCRRTMAEYAEILEVRFPDGTPAPLDQWAIPRALRGEVRSNVEYLLRRRDTGETWIGSYSFGPVRDADGAIVGSVAVGRDITDLKAVQFDLQASHAALQRMIAAQDRVQDEERARIARELHDDLQQTLAAVRIDLARLGEGAAPLAAEQRALVAELDGFAEQAIVSVRRIVDGLRPKMLEDSSLPQALRLLGERFARHSGIACRVDADEPVAGQVEQAPLLAGCLLRVAQEALNNASKHSRASAVHVVLAAVGTDQVSLSVSDNGLGIRARDRRKKESFGIEGMRERVRAQGGRLRVDRLAQGGTLVEALVPLRGAAAAFGAGHEKVAMDTDAGELLDEPALARADGDAEAGQAPLPRLLNRAVRHAMQVLIDAISGSAAVLERRGSIEFVNAAWIAFAERHGHVGARTVGPGVDYLEACRRAVADDPSVLPILEGMSQLVEGRTRRYACEYPCQLEGQVCWFRMEAARMADGSMLVVHHSLGAGARRCDGAEG